MRHPILTQDDEAGAPPQGHDRSELWRCQPALADVIAHARNAAANGATLLIEAERGCETAQLARFIHSGSPLAAGPFVELRGAALPADLLESGLLVRACRAVTNVNKTIFLAEIGDMTLALQATLLQLMQELEEIRGDAEAPQPAAVRIMASTQRDLEAAVRTGLFREELYIRLHVLRIPPLRERPGDIPCLVKRFCSLDERPWGSFRVSPGALAALQAHTWPGNVRELRRVVKQALALASRPDLGAIDFFPAGALPASHGILLTRGPELSDGSTREVERSLIEDALSRTSGNRTRAAAIVGISVRTLRNKLRAYRAS